MSNEINGGSAASPEISEAPENTPEFVPADDYQKALKAKEDFARDMHKYKTGVKEREAEINQLKAQLKSQEEAKMRENEQWQEIAQRREAEIEELKTEYSQKASSFEMATKRIALKQELGGSVKEEYLQFANLNSIQMDDNGIVDAESLRNVANEFRTQHGQLIPKIQENDITGHGSTIHQITPAQKSVKDMTHDEKVEALTKLYKNK